MGAVALTSWRHSPHSPLQNPPGMYKKAVVMHSFLLDKSDMFGEFLECFGIPFFDFQPLKTGHSVHLGTEMSMTPPYLLI